MKCTGDRTRYVIFSIHVSSLVRSYFISINNTKSYLYPLPTVARTPSLILLSPDVKRFLHRDSYPFREKQRILSKD